MKKFANARTLRRNGWNDQVSGMAEDWLTKIVRNIRAARKRSQGRQIKDDKNH